MSKNKKLIPELRFPEFQDEGEWDEKKLEEVAAFSKGKGISKSDVVENGVLPCIRYGELYTHYNETINDTISYTNVPAKELVLSQANDVIIPSSGETQEDIATASCVMRGGIALGGDLNIIRSEMNGVFLSYYLNNVKKKEIAQMAQGISVVHLYSSQLKYLNIVIPSKAEQNEIAACLSSLDEVIAAHRQKLKVLKEHKKGLMQNLFPQGGEKVPKYRFKEFKDDGMWEKKKLGEIAEFINGRAYKQEEFLSKGKYRVLRVGNFFTNNEWYFSDLELEEDKYCEKGDLLYAWSASFGPRMWNEEKVIYHYHIWKVRNKIEINRQFLYHLLDLETFKMKSKSLNGFALMHITKGSIESWESFIPKSEKEQQKIASCLSTLDAITTAQSERLEQLRQYKKGLMQGLFPKINA